MVIQVSALQPNSEGHTDRTHFGVGEAISFSSSHRLNWDINDHNRYERELIWQFLEAGTFQVRGRTRSGIVEETSVHVHAPRLHLEETSEGVVISRGCLGVGLTSQYTLTPLEANFSHLQIKEEHVGPTSIWGYFDDHRGLFPDSMNHNPMRGTAPGTQVWKVVDNQNRVVGHDVAMFELYMPDMDWPVTRGGFTWLIPCKYRIGEQEFDFSHPIPQTHRIETRGVRVNPPFKGSLIITKATLRAERDYI